MKRNLWLLPCFVLICMCFAAFGATANGITYLAGDVDEFTTGGADQAYPSAELSDIINDNWGGLKGFDEYTGNRQCAHTFTGLPSKIAAATLEVRVQAAQGASGLENDGIILSFVDRFTTEWLNDIVFLRTFGPYTGDPGCTPGPHVLYCGPDDGVLQSTPWSSLDKDTLILDLSALPLADGETLNLLSELENHGFLDVTVNDDTAVDYIKLDLTPGCGGQKAWNFRWNGDDRFHDNTPYLRPWRYDYEDGWGRWVGEWAYELQWSETYTESSGSASELSWAVDSNGRLTVTAGSADRQWHAWTYVYVNAETDLENIDPIMDNCMSRVFLNTNIDSLNFDDPIQFPDTLTLLPGWNRIDITGYNQHESHSFDLNYPLGCHVDEMDSDPTECHCADSDGDGVPDAWDECPDTPLGSAVFSNGCRPTCAADFDGDGDVDGSDLAVFAADFGRTDCP